MNSVLQGAPDSISKTFWVKNKNIFGCFWKIKEKHFAHTFEKNFTLKFVHILEIFYICILKKNNRKSFWMYIKKHIFQKIFVHTFWINIERNHWKCSFVHKFWNIWKSLKISFIHIFSFGKLIHIFLKHYLWKVYWKNYHL